MTGLNIKSIYISYSKNDKTIATKLHHILHDLLGQDAWLRDFSLDGGTLISDSIASAISEAKWFIILLSAHAIESVWLKMEADVATIRSLEDNDFQIIVIKLDNTEIPSNLKLLLGSKYTIDISATDDLEAEFLNLADYIDRTDPVHMRDDIYVDRGADADKFSLSARRNSIIFILGMAGIGKSSFITRSVADKLRKRPLCINLTRGHSMDMLARQIIQRTHVVQPIHEKATDQELALIAINALKKREDKFFLCIDNAEEGLDVSNHVHQYLEIFIMKFIEAGIRTHIILATSRNPEYPPAIAKSCDVVRITGLPDEYIRESIDLWLEGTNYHSRLMKMPELDDLVNLAGGYPLAAKMISSFLKVKPPEEILLSTQKKRFQLQLAEYILRSAGQSFLTDIHILILQVLAAVREPMSVEDLYSVTEIKEYGIDDIHKARSELLDLFLVEQNYEVMSLHNFLGAYFRDQLGGNEERFTNIATDFGQYAYDKALQLNFELTTLPTLKLDSDDEEERKVQLSNEIFRYAVPAGRLLIAVGKDELAKDLPIRIKGTLREMVFYFYQEKRDYKKALQYAEKWLKVSPGDLEILLFQARCYRNLRDGDSLTKAGRIISIIEKQDYSKRFAARVFREKALIAQNNDDIPAAKDFFRKGIEVNTRSPYPENRTGLALLLLREAEEMPHWKLEKQAIAEEALELLERARESSATFDRFHLGTYIEALIQAGKESVALPLLEEALRDRPDDERLNYRMAEILRKQEQYSEATKYAQQAINKGSPKAFLTLANILYSESIKLSIDGDVPSANAKLREALTALSDFRPEFGHDQEIADAIASKIYRSMGDFPKARQHVGRYQKTDNPYTIYEQCRILVGEASTSLAQDNYPEALSCIRSAKSSIEVYKIKRELPEPLQELLEEIESEEARINAIING